MKAQIHPNWFEDAKIRCACGNVFTVGATMPEISVEICYNCHPFYTGNMKFVDTAGRVDAFKAKQSAAGKKIMSKTEKRKLKKQKRLQEEAARPETLTALREQK